jgi:hypothetical protein
MGVFRETFLTSIPMSFAFGVEMMLLKTSLAVLSVAVLVLTSPRVIDEIAPNGKMGALYFSFL